MFVSEMLPPPDVTTVLETQKSTPKAASGRKQAAQEVSVLQIQQPNILKIRHAHASPWFYQDHTKL